VLLVITQIANKEASNLLHAPCGTTRQPNPTRRLRECRERRAGKLDAVLEDQTLRELAHIWQPWRGREQEDLRVEYFEVVEAAHVGRESRHYGFADFLRFVEFKPDVGVWVSWGWEAALVDVCVP